MADGKRALTPALGDAQTRKLLEAPPGDTLNGVRDRVILPIPLYPTACAARSCAGLRVRDMQNRQRVVHFRVRGKRGKIRFVLVHATAQRLIEEYLPAITRESFGVFARYEEPELFAIERRKISKLNNVDPALTGFAFGDI